MLAYRSVIVRQSVPYLNSPLSHQKSLQNLGHSVLYLRDPTLILNIARLEIAFGESRVPEVAIF